MNPLVIVGVSPVVVSRFLWWYRWGMAPSAPAVGTPRHKEDAMIHSTAFTTTYAEACEHAERNYRATNGMVCGGSYMVRFEDGDVAEVELRVDERGLARFVDVALAVTL